MVRGLAEEEAERERDWVGEETLKESPLKEEEVRLMGVEEKEKGGRWDNVGFEADVRILYAAMAANVNCIDRESRL